MLLQQAFRQARILPAEHQIGAVRVLHIRIAAGGLGGEKEAGAAVFGGEILPVVVIGDVQQMPVIQPGPLELAVVHGEAHGADQVQPCAGGGAGAGDVAGVLGDLRFQKYNVQGRQNGSRPCG